MNARPNNEAATMGDRQPADELIERGAKEGARLFREWFQNLSRAGERGEPAAYVFVMGSEAVYFVVATSGAGAFLYPGYR
jgi:hypothetical protein